MHLNKKKSHKIKISIYFFKPFVIQYVTASHSWRNFQSIGIKEIFLLMIFSSSSTWLVYVFFSPSVNSIYVKWRWWEWEREKYHCSQSYWVSIVADGGFMQISILRNEKRKDTSLKNVLFRKRNFSSGWVRWAQSIFPALSQCFFKRVWLRKRKNN